MLQWLTATAANAPRTLLFTRRAFNTTADFIKPNAVVVPQLAQKKKGHANGLPAKPIPPPDSEIEEYFIKGSGPGGQKIVRLYTRTHTYTYTYTHIYR